MTKETLPMVVKETDSASSHFNPQSTTASSSSLTIPASSPQHSYSQQQQPPPDCMPCKIVGCAGFGGLGLYSFYQAQQLPKTLVARRLGLGLMGTAFIAAAVYRLTIPIAQGPSAPLEK